MTISTVLARFIAEEHKFKPLPKELHLLGRQTILLSIDQMKKILADIGLDAKEVTPVYDTETRQANVDGSNISDKTFFEMLGVERLRAIDHSNFEGADIVFDLTKDLPPDLADSVDFIFDGSVMDNIFDPASAMQNVAKMLRPGGRYLGTNAASIRWLPAYVAFNPYWFFDFFVINGFTDVKIYVCDFGKSFHWSVPGVNCETHILDACANHRDVHAFPVSSGAVALVIIAEKGEESTSHERISQGVYRLDDEWEKFEANLKKIQHANRPALSWQKQADAGGAPGFIYVGNIDEQGISARSPNVETPVLVNNTVMLGEPFAGFGWGAVGTYGGSSWRWIDDSQDEGIILVRLPQSTSCKMVAFIHTARDVDAIQALRASVNGIPIAEQTIVFEDGVHRLVARIESTFFSIPDRPIRIGFSVNQKYGVTSDGGSIALSRVIFSENNEVPSLLEAPSAETREQAAAIPLLANNTVMLGNPFAGSGWGAVGTYGGSSWRWIDDSQDEGIILVRLPQSTSYKMVAFIHTARDMDSIQALRASVNGIPVAEQTIVSEDGVHTLVASIESAFLSIPDSLIRIGFSVNQKDMATTDSGSVALSHVIFSENCQASRFVEEQSTTTGEQATPAKSSPSPALTLP